MKKVTCTICLMAISLIAGCTTIMSGPTQEITVTSNPPGAIVTPTDYKCWVKTPGIIELDRNNSTILTARLLGYEDMKVEIECGLNFWIFGNGAGQLYPWSFMSVPHGAVALGMFDLSTGSIGELSPTEIHFELVPKVYHPPTIKEIRQKLMSQYK